MTNDQAGVDLDLAATSIDLALTMLGADRSCSDPKRRHAARVFWTAFGEGLTLAEALHLRNAAIPEATALTLENVLTILTDSPEV